MVGVLDDKFCVYGLSPSTLARHPPDVATTVRPCPCRVLIANVFPGIPFLLELTILIEVVGITLNDPYNVYHDGYLAGPEYFQL
jgi:hypothetical protein